MRRKGNTGILGSVLFGFVFMGGLLAMGSLLAFASEGHGGGGDHSRQLWDLLWRIIDFLVLVGFLVYLLKKPVRGFLNKRQQDIVDSLQKAEEAREEAKRRYREVEQELATASERIQELTRMLEEQGAAEKKRILENAEREAARIRQQAEFMAEQEVKKAQMLLRQEAIELAAAMAENLLKEKITEQDHRRLVKDYIEKVVKPN